MVVDVPGDGRGTPRLHAAEDLGALSVRAEASSSGGEHLSRALRAAGAGEVVGDHAWLDLTWLRAAAGERDQRWKDGFVRMVGYAREHGWLSADGNRVRAHIEWRLSDDD